MFILYLTLFYIVLKLILQIKQLIAEFLYVLSNYNSFFIKTIEKKTKKQYNLK